MWFLDHEYLEIMYTMFRKVNGKCCCSSRPERLLSRLSSRTGRRLVSHRSEVAAQRHLDQRTDPRVPSRFRSGDHRRQTEGLGSADRSVHRSRRDSRCKQRDDRDEERERCFSRMVVQLRRPSNIYHRRSEPKKRRKSAWNICCETFAMPRWERYLNGSAIN